VTSDLAAGLDVTSLDGALVVELDDMGPAAFGELQRGDIIVRFDGHNVKDARDLSRIVADTPPGKRADVVVIRRGKQETHVVTTGRMPDATDTAGSQSKAGGTSTPASPAQTTLGLEISSMSSELRRKFNLKDGVHGLVVTAVDPSSGAAEKQVTPGAVIVELQWHRVTDPAQFKTGVEQLRWQGKSHALLLVSDGDGQKRYVTLKLK
jgi:serine protease Do